MKQKKSFIRRLLLSLLFMAGTAAGATAQDMTATPLTFEAVVAGAINIINPNGLTIEYSKDGTSWTSSNADPISISVAAGDAVRFRGDNPAYGKADMMTGEKYTRFTATNDVYVYGNVMSLISSTTFPTLTTLERVGGSDEWAMDINLAYLFSSPESGSDWIPKNNTTIRNHPTKDIVLPATNATRSGYMYMFAGCQGLTRAPELPATDLSTGCYHRMFDSCTGLEKAPVLATATVPMSAYSCMFAGCSNLKYVKCLATDISADDCTGGWLTGVAAEGIFIKADGMNDWTVGPQGEWNEVNGIPAGWTVKTVYAVTMPSSGIATFSAADAVSVPEGLTAYTCSSFDADASAIILQPVSSGLVPAATGVLLRGEGGAVVTLEPTAETVAPVTGNLLVAVTTPTHVPATSGDYTNFMLSHGTFVKIEDADESVMMPARKAYLQLPTASIVSGARTIGIDWDAAPTHISLASDDSDAQASPAVFDLQGRRVNPAAVGRGLYIINGKKTYIK